MKNISDNEIEASSNEVLANVRALLDASLQDPGTPDPAPTVADLTLRRMSELMAQVSDGAIGELRRLRDDVDSTIRQIQTRHAELTTDFEHHVACVIESMQFRAIASEHLDSVRARFAIPAPRVERTERS